MVVRVRFAPSPTGLLHLGGARTALFNFLFARASRGSCVLRVEDTDRERNVPDAVEKIERSLRWLGVEFDEGPSQGGKFGPYLQSERLQLYQYFAKQLVQREAAYPCFCSKERLEALRSVREGGGYDGHCRALSKRQAEEKLRMGAPHTIRLKVPMEGCTVIEDKVYGEVQVSNSTIDDQILMKTDGYPTYHLAAVVDDRSMAISHVLRGEEWLLSTAKHVLVYNAMDWVPPRFIHLPLLHSSSGDKLSKRNSAVHVESYQERGFLPEAVLNFIALLGWSPRHQDQEVLSLKELVDMFSLEGLTKKPAVVDEGKLLWMNKQHFRRKLSEPAELQQMASQLQRQLLCSELRSKPDDPTMRIGYLKKALLLLKERISLVPLIPKEASYFWENPTIQEDALLLVDNAAQVLDAVRCSLGNCDFSIASINSTLKTLAGNLNVPYPKVMMLCRIAVTGSEVSPNIAEIMELLGRTVTVQRLERAYTLVRQQETN